AILAGFMQGLCKASWFEKLKEGMLRSNQAAAKIFSTHKVEACTDITGFGLAGHLLEMLDSSGFSSQLTLKNIRKYDGFDEIKNKGILSTLHEDNTKVSCRFNSPVEHLPAELFDPQTSGGLLAGVNPESCDQILKELFEAGYRESSMIGTVIEKNSGPTILLDMQ
ncbi:MAG: AIR synthase-related protein, partial [Gemmataceae bacterium]